MTFYLLGNNVRWVKCVFTYATNLTFWYRLSIPLYHHCTMSIEYYVGLFGRCDGHCEINSSMVDEYVTRHRKLAKRTSRQMYFNVPNSRVTYFKTKSCCSVHSGWISLSTLMLNWDFAVFLHEDGIYFLFTYKKPQEERGWCDCGRHSNQADSWIFVFFSFFPPWLW